MTDAAMTATARGSGSGRLASLRALMELGLALRLLAVVVVHGVAQRAGELCLFDDTRIYWELARTIRRGGPYEVSLWGVPHFALRPPGYPLFLAACQTVFGERVLPVRLVQAGLGVASIAVVFRLVGRVRNTPIGKGAWTVPLAASALVAVEPYTVGISALVLSEALFVLLMLLTLWGLATLWPAPEEVGPSPPRAWNRWWSAKAVATGLAAGSAALVRASFVLFIPLMLLAWVAFSPREHRARALRGAVLVGLGTALAMAPWWVRNAQVFGRFVPTALWAGASLYDGLNPQATGASDMEFLNDPDIWPLDEETQDAELMARALAFAREHPVRAAELAAIKAARYWSPWPHAEMLRAPGVALASAVVTLPLFALMLIGAWDRLRQRDIRTLLLLAGPLLYFAAVHMVFVGSIRYRIPAAVPALGLAAIGLEYLINKVFIIKNKEHQNSID